MQDEHLEKAIAELAKRENEFVAAANDLPAKKHEYKLKFAVAVQIAEGSVAAKEAAATKACTIEYLAYLKAEARSEIAKTLLYDVRTVIEARRSLLSNEKSEREFAGKGGEA